MALRATFSGEVIVKRETAKPLNAPKIGARVLAVSFSTAKITYIKDITKWISLNLPKCFLKRWRGKDCVHSA